MNISILSYSFRGLRTAGEMDVFGYLESCKYRYHLDAADIWSGFLDSTEDAYIEKVRWALVERDLVLADLAVDGPYLWDEDPERREANYRNALIYLRVAHRLGARFMRLDAGGGRDDPDWTPEQFDYIVMRYKEYAQFAHDHGFRMGAENHWGPEKRFRNLKRLIDAVDHPGFGISCHLSSWAGPEEEQANKLVSPWVCHTHIAWYVCQDDLAETLAVLRDANYQGYYSVEHHSGQDEYDEVAVQVAKVRNVLNSWRLSKT